MTIRVLKSINNEYYVRVVASNGLTLAHSQNYNEKATAVHCARLIKTEAGGAPIIDAT